jgi:DNA-binding NarL/FixJ family response regulator
LVARLVEEFRDREARRVPLDNRAAARLTGREWDVLELLREGCDTAEIANRLFISQTTVRTHVSAVLRKLKVADRNEAINLLR